MNDAGPHFLTFADYAVRVQEAPLAQLGEVNEALQSFFNTDEGAEFDDASHDTLDNLPNPVAHFRGRPGIGP